MASGESLGAFLTLGAAAEAYTQKYVAAFGSKHIA